MPRSAGKLGQRGTFLKLGLRRAQAISLVNTAIVLDLGSAQGQPGVKSAVITLGAVAPTIIHATEAEAYLAGKELTDECIARAAELAAGAARPIDDIRSSAAYRKAMVRVLVMRGAAVPAGWTGTIPGARISGAVVGKRLPRSIASSLNTKDLHRLIHFPFIPGSTGKNILSPADMKNPCCGCCGKKPG